MAIYKGYGYDIQDGKAIIPEWETEIRDGAFNGCKELTSVELPLWINKIGNFAFSDCSSLTSISIPESVTKIGEFTFYGCSSLSSVHISDIATWCNIVFRGGNSNPLSLAHRLYINGEEIRDLVIPDSVTEIGGSAFEGCSSLTSISIPESVTEIGEGAFSGCSSLTSVTIPPSVTEIGKGAFRGCSSLTEVRIPKGCNVDEDAFEDSPNVQIIRY